MEEALVDSALDLNQPPSEYAHQRGGQGDIHTDTRRDQAQLLASVQKGLLASRRWPQNRAARLETLRQRIASGAYQIDSAELAQLIWRNSTRFLESC